jgi:hypothetical protein
MIFSGYTHTASATTSTTDVRIKTCREVLLKISVGLLKDDLFYLELKNYADISLIKVVV